MTESRPAERVPRGCVPARSVRTRRFIRQGFGSRGEKFGACERVAIVEMVCELRSCGDGVVAQVGELFAKMGQLLGKWRIIHAVRPEVIAGPQVVAEMGLANKSWRSDPSLRLARRAGAMGSQVNDQDFKDRGFRWDPRVASGAVSFGNDSNYIHEYSIGQ